jgi:hypothetical protein
MCSVTEQNEHTMESSWIETERLLWERIPAEEIQARRMEALWDDTLCEK